MKKKPEIFLKHILESIEIIEKYLKRISRDEFFHNIQIQDAVIRRVVFVGSRKITKVDATHVMPAGWQSRYYVFDSPKIKSLIIFYFETNEKGQSLTNLLPKKCFLLFGFWSK